ncbi:MAG: ABC transporter ATP-binding protein [Chloroflexota bacterium]|nr:ABC transporter ATP-binding protein [Chloroflexota bacterium]
MSDIAVHIEDIGKEYHIGAMGKAHTTARDALVDTVMAPLRRVRSVLQGRAAVHDEESFWALKSVSFDVSHGEVVGIIGRNGAGKSTLLKILARITEPTRGYATVHGRVGALLEVGTGFHPELSGRENVYLNGAILGMSRQEIARKFDEIVAFANIEKFIDTPVKHYSSGMGLRLGFAVAAHLEPEILIVDEVLAVGDTEFQRKCLGKMQDVSQSGRTVLFVSHNMGSVRALCSRCVVLKSGTVEFDGSTDEGIGYYLAQAQVNIEGEEIPADVRREGSGIVRFEAMRLLNQYDEPISVLTTGEAVTFELDYRHVRLDTSPGNMFFFIHFNTLLGERLFNLSTRYAYSGVFPPPSGTIRCTLPRLPLVPGSYIVEITCKIDKEIYDHISGIKTVQVSEGDYYGTGKVPPASGGSMLIDQDWAIADERVPLLDAR